MALPASRSEFKRFCLQEIGLPVLEINMSDEQIENQIDMALSYYTDFHFDATQRTYYKIPVTANLHSDVVRSVSLTDGGTLYSNTDTFTVTGGAGSGANGTITTYANGTISALNLATNGNNYSGDLTLTISTSTGSGATATATLGGYIELPENILGVSKVFPFHFLTASSDMFSVDYQFALNNLYTIANSQLVPYFMAKQHLQLFQEILVGRPSFRFNRHNNKLFVDVLNQRLHVGEYIVIEAYMVIDPAVYTDIWKDRFLIRYCCALLKRLWGFNTKKFNGAMMPGGISYNGQQMYDEAVIEVKELEAEMLNTWSLPVYDIIA